MFRGLLFVVACAVAAGSSGEVAAQSSQDEKEIHAAAAAYLEALARGDGKALAALWTADGDIVDAHGVVMKGRETVGPSALPDPGAAKPEYRVHDTSLRFLTPDVALEDGSIDVVVPGAGLPQKGRFSATWIRQGGTWKLAGLREAQLPEATGAAQLADLDWMVGDWTVVDNAPAGAAGPPRPTIEVTVRWNAGRTFLLRDMKITPVAANGAEPPAPLHVSQRIGWDPLSRQIRSWVFSADGGHGEAFWSRDGGSWIARTTAVLPDGSQTSSLNVYTYDGKDRCTWQSFHTHAGGEHLPPVNMTMIRKPGRPVK
ncbi:MAG: nuclear transport factor 2 family protein [Planctomycetia bacterium]|nr:nuclear transport factor 2 family protein [Planctomycetia bacterium]